MAKKSQPGKDKQIASAFLLSFPQLFVWALVFALIGGITVWSGFALTRDKNNGTIFMRMVVDNNNNGQPNWGDTVSFDVSTSSTSAPELKLTCYQNGRNVFFANETYGLNATDSHNILLKSAQWSDSSADCTAVLLSVTKDKVTTLGTYNFHVSQ